MDQTDKAKVLAQYLDKDTAQTRRPVKDLKTAILKGLSDEPTNDIKKEYAKEIRNIKMIKTAIIFQKKTNKINDATLVTEANKIIKSIDDLLNGTIETPRPKIYGESTFKKYAFKDGSESTFENYEQVKNTVVENTLLNLINKISSVYSDGLGFLAQIEKSLWERDDGIEEIDFTGEDNNGR